jgi:hypothetical protein
VFSTPANTTKTYDRFSDMADDVLDGTHLPRHPLEVCGRGSTKQGTAASDWAVSLPAAFTLKVTSLVVATTRNIRQNAAYDETT